MDLRHTDAAAATDASSRRSTGGLLDRRRSDGTPGWLFRRVSRRRSLVVVGTVLGIAAVTALEKLSASDAISSRPQRTRAESTLTALNGRTAALERFRDTVIAWREVQRLRDDSTRANQQMQTYMLCMLTRETLPIATPPGCAPVVNAARRSR